MMMKHANSTKSSFLSLPASKHRIGILLALLAVIAISTSFIHHHNAATQLQSILNNNTNNKKSSNKRRYMTQIPKSCKGKERILDILQTATDNAIDKRCKPSVESLLSSDNNKNKNTDGGKKKSTRSLKTKAIKKKKKKVQHVYGMTTCNLYDLCDDIPTWKQVVNSYGAKPVIIGMETCNDYRKLLNIESQPATIRIAGLYNTGTNAITAAIQDNFNKNDIVVADDDDDDSTFSKHTPLKYYLNNDDTTATTTTSSTSRQLFGSNSNTEDEFESILTPVLPIVIVRDPFRWMASMCKTNYDAEWMRVPNRHCPNLVPVAEDWNTKLRSKKSHPNLKTYKVTVKHGHGNDVYDSLADMWTDYYEQYLYDTDFPRLIIRFEDFLYHREDIIKSIGQCVGVKNMNDSTNSKYRLSSVKNHGRSSDYVTAVIKYGSNKGRYAGMATADLRYAKNALNTELMETFHYLKVPDV